VNGPSADARWIGNPETPPEVSVGDALCSAAAAAPERVALLEGHPDPARRREWTYAALLDEAQRAAAALLERFASGDRIGVFAPNLPEWVVLEFAAALAGLTLVTVNPALREDELRDVLRRSHVVGVFAADEYRGRALPALVDAVSPDLSALREVIPFSQWRQLVARPLPTRLPSVPPSSIAQIQFTSGTTGAPKGAMLRHGAIVRNASRYGERFVMRDGEIQLSPMPLFHTAGCVMSVLGTLSVHGTLVLPAQFEPGLCLDLLEATRATSLLGVPTMLVAMLEHERFERSDLSALERVLSGGAVVPPDLVERVERATHARCTQVFAQTEASPVITQSSPEDRPDERARTLGRPLPGIDVSIVDRNGNVVEHDVVGEIITRGYHVMAGYLDDPEATAAAIDADGWLHTGDLGSMDARGFCRVRGRLKDVVIRGGENIFPAEIEAVLRQHPAVVDAAVVGAPDSTWGEQVAAFVRLGVGAIPDERALDAHVRAHLAPHKAPKLWFFVDELPLTGSGKVKKYELRERVR